MRSRTDPVRAEHLIHGVGRQFRVASSGGWLWIACAPPLSGTCQAGDDAWLHAEEASAVLSAYAHRDRGRQGRPGRPSAQRPGWCAVGRGPRRPPTGSSPGLRRPVRISWAVVAQGSARYTFRAMLDDATPAQVIDELSCHQQPARPPGRRQPHRRRRAHHHLAARAVETIDTRNSPNRPAADSAIATTASGPLPSSWWAATPEELGKSVGARGRGWVRPTTSAV
jgi:hypothetical protein